MMTLHRAGGFPYNLLSTVCGNYERKSNDTRDYWEDKINSFITELEQGGDESIVRDWYMCVEYFDGTVSFDGIAKRRSIMYEQVQYGIYRVCELLSMYWFHNPNFTKATQDFLFMVIQRTGDTRAVDVLRAAGITSNRKLLSYCEKYGIGFERMPALKDSSKRAIQCWVRDTGKFKYGTFN